MSSIESAPRGLLALAAATPPDRDRYVDFLRAFSILAVVAGHWLIAVVVWRDGVVEGYSALEAIQGLWIVTWVFQVMPLFFFVGGFANLRTWRSELKAGRGYAAFVHGRMVRLMRPTLVFLGLGLAVTVTLDALNVADNVVFPASELITRPLWFLGVYMIVVTLAPAMIAIHDRLGVWAVVGLVGVAIGVDVVRFGLDVNAAGYLNYPVVWLLAHQMGFLYADGRLAGRTGPWMAPLGLLGMAALINLGPYPASMVGLSTDEFSNMDPPTLAIVALIVWQVGGAMMLRAPISRWLARLRVWAGVIYVNSVIMTIFLWHLTAMLLGIGVLYPLGWPQPEVGTASWWALRPVWLAVLLVILSVFVLGLGRFEQRGLGRRRPAIGAGSGLAAVVAATLIVWGVLGFALGGMHQLFSIAGTELLVFQLNPFQNILHLVLGGIVVRASIQSRAAARLALIGAAAGLLSLAIIGWADPEANRLAANQAANLLHAALALLTLLAIKTKEPRSMTESRSL
ncbi:MAG: acyltransferase family protein [Acidimicrobiia bacterium]